MRRILLVRHGETSLGSDNRTEGQQDVALSDAGQAQADALATVLQPLPVDVIYSSDTTCAMETAQAINRHHDQRVRYEAALREIALGKFEGLTADEMRARYPQDFSAWEVDRSKATHGGETVNQLAARVRTLLEAITHDSERLTVVVAHSGPLRMLICEALRLPHSKYWRFNVDPASITELKLHHRSWTLHRLNDMSHITVDHENHA